MPVFRDFSLVLPGSGSTVWPLTQMIRVDEMLQFDEQSVVQDFQRDGAVAVRGVIEPAWIERMQEAVERAMAVPADTAAEYTPGSSSGRFFGDFFVWLRDPCFAEFSRYSRITELAARTMQSDEVYFFYDHLLVKEPNTGEPTPLHHDLPYWPLTGQQILSVWVPLDPVSKESGAVQYIAGSHKWGKLFAPASFSKQSGFDQQYSDMGLEPTPELESIPVEHSRLCWDAQPGDVIIHHPLTLHFAEGNSSANQRRRAIALRFVGDDARYSDKPGTFIKNTKLQRIADRINLADGAPLRGELFPCVWPQSS